MISFPLRILPRAVIASLTPRRHCGPDPQSHFTYKNPVQIILSAQGY